MPEFFINGIKAKKKKKRRWITVKRTNISFFFRPNAVQSKLRERRVTLQKKKERERNREKERERGEKKNQKIYNKVMIKNRGVTFYREKKNQSVAVFTKARGNSHRGVPEKADSCRD